MEIAIASGNSTSKSSPQVPPLGGLPWLGFYVLAPLLSALPLGWYGAGIAAEMPFAASMLLWISICMISWWLSDMISRSISRLAAGNVAPIICLTIGYGINLLFSSVYNPAVLWWMVEASIAHRTPAVEAYFAVDRNLLNGDYLRLLLVGGTPGLMVWLVGNYLFELITGVRRVRPDIRPPADFAHAPADASDERSVPPQNDSKPSTPRFFNRLTRLVNLAPEELLAVEAEDHYIQVHTRRGKELIYYRFGDALEELSSLDGLRIHRSAWISKKAIDQIEGEGRNMHVRLSNGERLRVSLSNRGAVLNARLNS